MWKQLKIPYVYTIEASFFGPSTCINFFAMNHFSLKDLEEIGEITCKSLLVLYKLNKDIIPNINYEEIYKELLKNKSILLSENDNIEDDSENEENKNEGEGLLKNSGNLIDTMKSKEQVKNKRTKSTFGNLSDYAFNNGGISGWRIPGTDVNNLLRSKQNKRRYITLVDASTQTIISYETE